MAESNESSWFGSWISAAKNKSTEVLEFVKKDLEEFGTTVKNEASSVVSNTGSAIGKTLKFDEPDSTANTMKRSISSFLGQMNEVLNPSPDDSDTEAILITEDSGTTITLTKLQQAIYNLQKTDDTFLQDPSLIPTLSAQFQCWLEVMDEDLSNERIAKLLQRSQPLKEQYTKLVPDIINNETFWKRYMFKKALIEDEIAREEDHDKRKQKEKSITEENLEWEKEDFANDIILTEEEQIRILQQYDNETKLKREKFSKNTPRKLSKKPENDSETEKLTENDMHTETNVIVTESLDKVANKEENILESTETTEKTEKIEKTANTNSNVVSSASETNVSSNSSTDGEWEKVTPTQEKNSNL